GGGVAEWLASVRHPTHNDELIPGPRTRERYAGTHRGGRKHSPAVGDDVVSSTSAKRCRIRSRSVSSPDQKFEPGPYDRRADMARLGPLLDPRDAPSSGTLRGMGSRSQSKPSLLSRRPLGGGPSLTFASGELRTAPTDHAGSRAPAGWSAAPAQEPRCQAQQN